MRANPLVLVTGATGFIGRVLCERLVAQGARVRAMARKAVSGPWHEFVELDLAGDGIHALSGVDTVFHLAAKVHALGELRGDEQDYQRINVAGTQRLLAEAVEQQVPRFVYFSSIKAMGEGGSDCLDERAPSHPETAYGRSKLDAENAVLTAGETEKLHATVLRLPPVYGPGSKGNLFDMLSAVARRRFPPIAECNNRRSFVHVEDVARAAMMASSEPAANREVFIVCDDESYSTREIYELMCQSLGRPVPGWTMPMWVLGSAAYAGDAIGRLRGRRFMLDSDKLDKLTSSAWYSAAKIEKALGFRPQHSLCYGLGAMVEHDVRGQLSTVARTGQTGVHGE